MLPLPRTALSHGFRDRNAERGESLEDGYADLEPCDLTVAVSGRQVLAEQIDAAHFGFGTASAVPGFHGLAVLRGGRIAAPPRAAMAPGHLRVSKAPSAVTDAISCSCGIWSSGSGRNGASPTSLMMNAADWISKDYSSNPMWKLRQTLRLTPPCLRAFHSPLPSTLIPMRSTSRGCGPTEPQ